MILNHKQTIEYLVEGAGELTLSPGMVRTLHGMLSENLLSIPRTKAASGNSEWESTKARTSHLPSHPSSKKSSSSYW